MLKLWGAVFVIFAFNAIGQNVAKARRGRLGFIENMLAALSDFKTAISFFSIPLPRAIEKSGIESCEKYCEKLSEEDKKDFSLFMNGIKSETVDGQLSNITAYEKKLLKEEAEEREKYKKEARLIKGGFLLMGLLFTIMLL